MNKRKRIIAIAIIVITLVLPSIACGTSDCPAGWQDNQSQSCVGTPGDAMGIADTFWRLQKANDK